MADNVYFYCGNDEYLVGLNARKKVDQLCPAAEQSFSLEIIDGAAAKIDDAAAAIDQCLAAFRTVGLFGGKKVVWFRDCAFLKNAVVMKNDQVKRLLGDLSSDLKAGLAPDQFLVVSGPGMDKRSAFYKAIKDLVEIEEYDIPERDYEARPLALKRAQDLFKREGYSIDGDAAAAFIDKTGFETRQIMNEVEKMVLFKGADKTIVLADVQLMTSSSGEAITWDFTDAVAERRLPDAIRIFRQLLFQKQTAIGLIIQLETMFNNMLRFREYMDIGWLRMNGNRIQWANAPDIDDYFESMPEDPRKMHWFRASKIANQAAPYSITRLSASKRLVVDTHEKMVSGGSIPPDLMFETLLAKLCAPTQRNRPVR
ncbi:DNA polymerase III subunit delta [Pontiella sp.]|uniref:DNA polymerase III subunit delta n=1 Tax=Pontiella sp. TaxID=2837462 RepID=UPI003566F5AF